MTNWNHRYTQLHFNGGLDYRTASAALRHAARAYNLYEPETTEYELVRVYAGGTDPVVRVYVGRMGCCVEASGASVREAYQRVDRFVRTLANLGVSNPWRLRAMVTGVAVEFSDMDGIVYSLLPVAEGFSEYAYGHLYE